MSECVVRLLSGVTARPRQVARLGLQACLGAASVPSLGVLGCVRDSSDGPPERRVSCTVDLDNRQAAVSGRRLSAGRGAAVGAAQCCERAG